MIKGILSYFCDFIKKKTGFSISISAMKISVTGIIFKQIIVDKSTLHIEIDFIKIGLAIRRQFLSLHIGNLNCSRHLARPLSTTNTSELSDKQVASALRKLRSLFTISYPRILSYARIRIAYLKFFYKDHTHPIAEMENLFFERQKVVLELTNFTNVLSGYRIAAQFKPYKILYTVTCLAPNHLASIQLPRLNGKVSFATSSQQIIINAYARKLQLNHKKIANGLVRLSDLKISLFIDEFEDRLELNPDSSILCNNISLDMKGHFNYQEGLISTLIYITTRVESLVHLIPNIQQNPLKNFRSEGQVCVGISLGFLWADPLSYKFNLNYNVEDLKMITPGIDLWYLQNEFSFRSTMNPEDPYVLNVMGSEDGAKRTDLLARIIQLSEDPNFYEHKGIDSYFVGVAIANNLARKQFFKGASTLSMQLVKNLFLGEEKSAARKLEELILTLLMENYFNIPKERILDIYLQIIEFGPKVYGINEASKFYFNKNVEELSLLECLVISYIIPRPRFFLDALLAKSEQLDRNLSNHIENKVKMLVSKQLVNNDQLLSISRKIDFPGIGEFELTKLNIINLGRLFTTVN